MIIGEKNLIIGLKNSIVSDFSISIFFYITNTQIFFIKSFKKIFTKINPVVNSPPF